MKKGSRPDGATPFFQFQLMALCEIVSPSANSLLAVLIAARSSGVATSSGTNRRAISNNRDCSASGRQSIISTSCSLIGDILTPPYRLHREGLSFQSELYHAPDKKTRYATRPHGADNCPCCLAGALYPLPVFFSMAALIRCFVGLSMPFMTFTAAF